MINFKKSFVTVMLLFMILLLGACGENATTTNVASSTTSNSASTAANTSSTALTTTAVPTASSTTTNGAATTTVAATTTSGVTTTSGTSTTSSAVTTVAATAGAISSTSTLSLPAIQNATEINLSSDSSQQILKAVQLPASLTNATIKIYASDDAPATLATNADKAFTNAGYSFAIPGQFKPLEQQGNIIGIYTKSGALDLLTVITDPSVAFASGTAAPGTEDVVNQLKNRKSALIVVGASGMIQAITSGQSSGGSNPTGGTPSATTTTK